MKSALFFGAAMLAVAAPASAATFSFSGSFTPSGGTLTTATGTFTTTDTTTTVGSRQAYTITGVSGSFGGSAITGLLAAGTAFGGEPSDNYVFADAGYFTIGGVGFTVSGAALDYNFYTSGLSTFLWSRNAGVAGSGGNANFNGRAVAFSLTPANGGVPEPATWAMMIGGFGLAGVAMRRRATKVAFA